MSLSRGLFGVIVLCLAPVLFLSACGGGGGGGAVITTGGGGTGSGGSGGTSTGPISTPPRAFPGDYDIRLDPHIAAAEYSSATSALPVALLCDDAHGQVFVSDKAHNQISVLATTDAHLIAAIPLPAPVGMSLSVDHSTLYVGSENVQSLYVINAATLQVIRRVSLPTSLTLAGADTWPYALADGSVMMVAGTWQLSPGSWPNVMQLWHPDTGVFEPPLPDPNPNLDGFGMPLPVRSADGEYLLISAGGLYLYSTANHSIVASALNAAGNFPLAMAISADGSSIAQVTITDQAMADEADTLTFYDRSLRKIGQTQALKGSFQTLLYNGDGTVVYDSQAGQGAETVGIDSSTLAVTGYLAIGMNDMNPELPQGIDANGNLWGWHGGSVYKVADGLHRTYAPVPVGGTGLLISGPTTGPTSGSTEVAFQLPAGALDAGNPLSSMQAYFGASPALKDEVGNFFGSTNPMLLATTPPGSGGVAPVLLMDSEGNPNFLDDAFVYGPEILPRVPIALPPGGGAISLRGYGLVQDKGQGPVPNVVVKIGGQLADLTTAITNPYSIGQYPEQTITFPAPAGSPGWAELTVSTSLDPDSDRETLPRGVQYEVQQLVPLRESVSQIVYDRSRNLFYLMSGTDTTTGQVMVFDPAAGTTQTLAGATAVMGGLAISPDDHYLVAGAANGVVVYDLQTATAPQAVSLLQAGDGNVYGAAIAITSQDEAVVNLGGTCGSQSLRQVDLATLTVSVPSFSGEFCSPHEYAADSTDGSVLLFSEEGTSDTTGNSQRWDATAGTIASVANSPAFGRVAVDGDGQMAAAGFYMLGPDLRPRVPMPAFPGALNETGSLLYTGEGVYDTHNGRELLKYDNYAANAVAINPLGTQVLVAGRDSDSHPQLFYHHLAVVPLAVGTVTPAQGAAGTSIQVRGSGFVAGTVARMGGVAMSCAVTDSETMTCTVPALPVGGASMSLTNPDGQSYSFELAFSVQ